MSNKVVRLEAPDDAFVDQILADGSVAPRQKLIVLRSPQLERLKSRVLSFQQHIEIAERPFHDGRVEEEIKTIKEKAKLLKEEKNQNDLIVEEEEHRRTGGAGLVRDLAAAKYAAASAASAFLDAQMAADHAQKKKKDLADKLAVAKAALHEHQKFLEMMTVMTISSPIKGHFKTLVALGSFVRKGHTVGEIEP